MKIYATNIFFTFTCLHYHLLRKFNGVMNILDKSPFCKKKSDEHGKR